MLLKAEERIKSDGERIKHSSPEENSAGAIKIEKLKLKRDKLKSEVDRLNLENKRLHTQIEISKENRAVRRWLTKKLYRVSIIWLKFIAIIIVLLTSGLIHLSGKVAVSLIASSSGPVVGLLAICLRYFFSHPYKEK
jgi:hypothetical protein